MFNVSKKVSNEELKSSLLESINKNDLSLDYIKDKIRVTEDLYKFTEKDSDKEELDTLKYIELVLSFVGDSYSKSLKGLK